MIKKITITLVILLILALIGRLILADQGGLPFLSSKEGGDSLWSYETQEGTLTLTAYNGRADSVTVPDVIDGIPVGSLGDGTFAGNTRLKEVTIPDAVLIEGRSVFENCTSLSRMHLPAAQKILPAKTFAGCTGLTAIDLPDGLTTIRSEAFSGCIGLSVLMIPDSVTSIENEAFLNCSALNELRISRNLNNLGTHAFRGTPWLSKQTDEFVMVGNRVLVKYNGIAETVEVPLGVTQITDAFEDNFFPIEIILPESLTSIGPHAFAGCRSLETLNIPDRVRNIGESAFRGCSHLAAAVLPDSLQRIGSSAFQSCSALTRLLLPEGIRTLPSLSFANCDNLRTLQIPQSVETISDDILSFSGITDLRVYKGSVGEQFAVDKGIPYTYMQQANNDFIFQQTENGVQAVLYTGAVYDVVIPETLGGDPVISLSDILFQHNPTVRSVSLPESIQSISNYSFADMAELRAVKLPSTLKSIGAGAFMGDPMLGDLEIPASVEEIADDAFFNCPSLVIVAEEGTYGYDWAVKSGIRVKDSKKVSTEQFKFVDPYGRVLLAGYEGIDPAPEMPRYNEYGEFVTGIADEAFRGIEITSITIPEGYESIGELAFADDPVSLEITLPRSISSIGENCFENTTAVIYGYNGSYAEDYARKHKIKFLIIYEWEL